jgi:hypothetical protein
MRFKTLTQHTVTLIAGAIALAVPAAIGMASSASASSGEFTTPAVIAAGTAGAATGPVPVVYSHHAAGTAGAATGPVPVVYGTQFAGYGTAFFANWRFGYVAATVPVAACRIAPSKNPSAAMQLFGGTSWLADISVFCNGGTGSVIFFDQKSATTHALGAFRLSPRVGDRVRISINRNVSGHQDSFTATNLRTGRSQTVRVTTSTAVIYHHAFVGSAIGSNADVMPLPATNKLLWTFRNSSVATYSGVRGTLLGPWTTVKEIDRTSAGVTVMYPGQLSSSGADFSTYLHAAP